MKDSTSRYGAITRTLHWGMGLLILLQFLKFGDRINDGEHWIGQTLVPTHITLGVLLLVLFVPRILWALHQRVWRPPHEGPMGAFARVGHALLYLAMLLMPVTGILYMAGKGYGLSAFGVQWIAKSETETGWMVVLGSLHSPIAWAFLALVLGHVVAALYHHFVLRDDTLRRMTG